MCVIYYTLFYASGIIGTKVGNIPDFRWICILVSKTATNQINQ